MKTFWVTGRKSPSKFNKPIRPKSPIFNPREPFENDAYQAHHESWPRTKSVPVIRTPYSKMRRDNLTPEKWPQLDESMASPTAAVSNDTRASVGKEVVTVGNSTKSGINIEDVSKIQRLSAGNIPDELKTLTSGNIRTLNEFAQLAEENAERARQLANWAKHIASVAHSQTDTEDTNLSRQNEALKNHSVVPSYAKSSLGTSVDEDDDLSSTPIVEKKYCTIS